MPLQQQLRTFDLRQTGGAPGDGGTADLRHMRSVSLPVRRTRRSASTPVLPRQSLQRAPGGLAGLEIIENKTSQRDMRIF